jgi:hypothetical protein
MACSDVERRTLGAHLAGARATLHCTTYSAASSRWSPETVVSRLTVRFPHEGQRTAFGARAALWAGRRAGSLAEDILVVLAEKIG